MKLYRSATHPTSLFASSLETGWVMFPAEEGGWEKRQAVRPMDPLTVREVPLRQGFSTGIPGAPGAKRGRTATG
jgi:hypothetical protein